MTRRDKRLLLASLPLIVAMLAWWLYNDFGPGERDGTDATGPFKALMGLLSE